LPVKGWSASQAAWPTQFRMDCGRNLELSGKLGWHFASMNQFNYLLAKFRRIEVKTRFAF
jgi:hypothetical protein